MPTDTDRRARTTDRVRAHRTKRLLSKASTAGHIRRQRLLEDVVLVNRDVAGAIARRYVNRGVDVDDLEQVAYVGLVNAARRFDPDRGTEFLSFAVPTIRGEIQRYFRDNSWAIRPSRPLQDLHTQLLSVRPALTQELGRPPTSADLAERIGVSLETIEEVQAMDSARYYAPLSLDATSNDAGSSDGSPTRPLVDRLGTEDAELNRIEALTTVLPALATLTTRERQILKLRFVDEWSQQRIGEHIGVSQMQVSRLLGSILAQLRTQLSI
jgi:RNA polymerase sigma-B factor